MGLSSVPIASGGGIKLVQRGESVSSGNTTITAVDTTKTFLRSFSTGASGTVASGSSSTGTFSPSGGVGIGRHDSFLDDSYPAGSFPSYSGSRTFSGGTMDATMKSFGIHLVNTTTITATGACRWEIVEFA